METEKTIGSGLIHVQVTKVPATMDARSEGVSCGARELGQYIEND